MSRLEELEMAFKELESMIEKMQVVYWQGSPLAVQLAVVWEKIERLKNG